MVTVLAAVGAKAQWIENKALPDALALRSIGFYRIAIRTVHFKHDI